MEYTGKIYESNYGPVEILELIRVNPLNYEKYYKIKFLDTGTIAIKGLNKIKRKEIWEPAIKKHVAPKSKRSLYDFKCKQNWENMMTRCYNTKVPYYKYYGGKGITVDVSWHNFKVFYEDIKSLPGFDKVLYEKGLITIDKDSLQKDIVLGERVYSKDTCCFITPKEQAQHMTSSQALSINATSPEGKVYIAKGITKFAKEHRLDPSKICNCLKGRVEKYKGWTFKYI